MAMFWGIEVDDCREWLKTLPDASIQMCVTSPPYWELRNYGHEGQLGTGTMDQYIQDLVDVFREVRRVLQDDGTLWLNLGDTYTGSGSGAQGKNSEFNTRVATKERVRELPFREKAKNRLGYKQLSGIPWRVAFALQDDGWILRSDIIWHKLNPVPESVRDRPTKGHEYVFLFSKNKRYFYNQKEAKEPATGRQAGNTKENSKYIAAYHEDNDPKMRTKAVDERNFRTVWSMSSTPFKGGHFATFPRHLPERCILAGSQKDDIVLDPFAGAGTTGLVALALGRSFVGCEINSKYANIARERIIEASPEYRKYMIE